MATLSKLTINAKVIVIETGKAALVELFTFNNLEPIKQPLDARRPSGSLVTLRS